MKTEGHLRFVKGVLIEYVKNHNGVNQVMAQASVNTIAYVLDEDPVYEFEDFPIDSKGVK